MEMNCSSEAMRDHAQLIGRASAIASAVAAKQPMRILSSGQSSDRGQYVALARSDRPSLDRLPGKGIAVTYASGDDEASLGALIAATTASGDPIAADPHSLAILALADRLANSDIPVLVNGPTGTGKEVLARFIHSRSPRADKPFIAVNCAAMPETMLEALLFGHQKGAYTGAQTAGEGFFRAADGGTLLLDEIAEMPLALQAKLLRALQESEVVPLGATKPVKVDVRIIACANRDLPLEVEEGRFRSDLFYRLNVFPLALAALHERPEDIAPLAFALAMRHCPAGAPLPWISNEALDALRAHSWPGNIRELENVMRRALLLVNGERTIEHRHLHFDRPARIVPNVQPAPAAMDCDEDRQSDRCEGKEALSKVVQISEARAIMATLKACDGSRVQAAKRLGISERTLRYRLARFRETGQLAAAGGVA